MLPGVRVDETLVREPVERHRAVDPVAVPSDMRIVHAAGGAGAVTDGLGEAVRYPFEAADPVRAFPAYRGQRSYPGWWWSSTTGGHVVFESWLERHHIMEFDRRRDVTGISGQPFALVWTDGAKRRSHVPDLFVRHRDGSATVVDCRPVDRADDDFYRNAAVTAGVCEAVGWAYLMAGTPNPVRAANLRWLAGYRRRYVRDDRVADQLLGLAAVPVALIDAAGMVGDPVAVLPTLFQLLWCGDLEADLDRPLADHCLVWAG
jgi:hypothetical protein